MPPLEGSPLRRPRRDADAVRQGPQVRGAGILLERDGIRGTVNRLDLSVGTLGRDLPAALRGRRACGLTARAGRLASVKNLVRRAVYLLVGVRGAKGPKGKGMRASAGPPRPEQPPRAHEATSGSECTDWCRPGPGGLAAVFALAAACALALRKSVSGTVRYGIRYGNTM